MGVKLILPVFLIGMLFIVSCASETQEKPATPKLYIVEEPHAKVFVVDGKNPFEWVEETKPRRNGLNSARLLREDMETQEEFEIKSKLKNVRRVVDDELIVGFDEEIDNPKFKEILE